MCKARHSQTTMAPILKGKQILQTNRLGFKREKHPAYASILLRSNVSTANNLCKVNKLIKSQFVLP